MPRTSSCSAVAALGDLLNADADEVIFGRSMTALTFDLSRTLSAQWRPGDEIVVTRLDHDANVRPWVIAAAVGRRRRPVGGFRPGDLRTARAEHRGTAEFAYPPRRGHGRIQPDRHDARGAGHRHLRARRRRAAVRRRRALHRAPRSRCSALSAPTSSRARRTSSWDRTAAWSSAGATSSPSCVPTNCCPLLTGCPSASSTARSPTN